MQTRFTLTPVATALLLILGASAPVFADSSMQEEVDVAPGRQITNQEAATISSAAAKVLRHIAEARGDLQGDKPDIAKARAQLDQSDRLLEMIQASLPTTLVKDRIWVAKKHLEYEDSSEVLPDLVPIYGSLDELVDFGPTDQARTHLDQAKQSLEKGDKTAAVEHLQAVDAALLYAEADLPLHGTRQRIDQARAALAKDDAKAADQALKAAEDNVVFISIAIDSPLAQAKTSLWHAWQNHLRGAEERAKADLDAAGHAIERAAQSTDKATREAAAGLVGEVRELHGLLEAGDKTVTARLERTWHRASALSERSAAYLATGWQRLRADGAGSQDLIEAKLHLAYARIDHLYSKDDVAAKADLAEAKGYLNAVAGQLKDDAKAKVEAIAGQVADLEKALDEGDGAKGDATAFQNVETHLTDLIHQH